MEQKKMLHACLLDIAIEIRRICEKHNIDCFLVGGTLLGAIRHDGFIPWDDDLDIGLRRQDYEKFLKVCPEELQHPFVLTETRLEKNYGHPYAKVRIKDTVFYEAGYPQDIERGIFVDVFPIDRIPDNRLGRKWQAKWCSIWRIVLLTKCGYGMQKSRKTVLYKTVAAICSKRFIVSRLRKTQTRYNRKKTGYYENLCGGYRPGVEVFPSACLDNPLPKHIFEGEEFQIPFCSEEVLTLLYGDYMQLPPEEKRVFKHAISDIDFGDYAPKSNLCGD